MLSKEELKKLDIIKLMQEAYKAKKELFTIKFKVNTGQSKAIHKVKELKKYIARVKTIQSLKEREARGLAEVTKETTEKETAKTAK